MKKYLISTLAVLGSLYLSPCNAVSYCPGTTIAVGTKCNTLSNAQAQFAITTDCIEDDYGIGGGGKMKDTCLLYLCDGSCSCRTTSCATIAPIERCTTSCFSSISWGIPNYTGRQTGTATLSTASGCSNCATTLYRCADGYYATNAGTFLEFGVPAGTTSNSDLTCAACPKASDDSTLYIGAASYVASKEGLAAQSDCYIKANSEIPTEAGKYVYTSNCSYTTGS
ncbi:MAG: hypothetical protein K2I81_01445 [Alphaproteobacteria bacterium]|nr:hypothetical protein [Alphaproteobacteria bacterium]